MPDVDMETALDWRGRTVVGRDDEKIGTLKEIYLGRERTPALGLDRDRALRERARRSCR
jgi:hypothetical protein